jgi:23S rRNA pseudouridine1911/1915/1917 synthase
MMPADTFLVAEVEADTPLAAFLRAHVSGASWREVKAWIAAGKVAVDGGVETRDGRRVTAGQSVELRRDARRLAAEPAGLRIVHRDAQVVVVDKAAGIASVPYERGERGTALDIARTAVRRRGEGAGRAPLLVVHRIDKATSGLVVYARTKLAERHLARQFRAHDVERTYLCVAHGRVKAARIESLLVPDRGDGLRGSTRRSGIGKRAVTHVEPVRELRGATLCRVRLETGKTHQVRIHLAESGHPLVGEDVYVRDFVRAGGQPIESPRLLLHAATLGFVHPTTGERLRFESAPPADFEAVLRRFER